jgi:hypothetical protein
MNIAIRIYLRLSQKLVVLISLCTTAVMTVAIWRLEAAIDPSDSGMVGLQLAGTIEGARAILSSWRDGGADLFLRTAWLYYLYAVSSAVLLASAPGFFARQRNGFNPSAIPARDALFCMVPFAVCLADWAVQSMMVTFISGVNTSISLISALAAAAVVKWILLALCLLVLLRSYFATRKEKRRVRP